MNQQILWLRISYWAGAILDALTCYLMLSPTLYQQMFTDPGSAFQAGWEYRYAMAMGAALMAGWTVLLIWADRKPMERRDVLLITICPVIIGLRLSKLYLYWGGFLANPFALDDIALPAILVCLFSFAYWNSRPTAKPV